MTLVEKINEGIKLSMRSRDQLRLDTLRMMKSKILAVNARADLSDDEVIKLFKSYAGNIEEALEQARALNRFDAVDKLAMELAIVKEFLPAPLSIEETGAIVVQAIAQSGAKSKKELGLAMRAIMGINRSVDGKIARELANQLLED